MHRATERQPGSRADRGGPPGDGEPLEGQPARRADHRGVVKRICRACDVVFETPPHLVTLVHRLQFALREVPSKRARRDVALLHDVAIAAFLCGEEKS
jgi:hypothetical protein